MGTFTLPDLGEGLAEAEILEWHIKPGDQVLVDQPMVSVETAKAVVEIPVPISGTVVALHGAVGDIMATGAPLVEFDSGTVVGHLPTAGGEHWEESATPGRARHDAPRKRALPVARALARHLKVDLSAVEGRGADGLIRLDDVLAHATLGTAGSGSVPGSSAAVESAAPRSAALESAAPILAGLESAALGSATLGSTALRSVAVGSTALGPAAVGSAALGSAAAAASPGGLGLGLVGLGLGSPAGLSASAGLSVPPGMTAEPLRGARRAMAQSMSLSRDQVSGSTVCDDADVHGWTTRGDTMTRLIRALIAGCAAEPALNAWYDSANNSRVVLDRIDLAIAVDTAGGLIIPVLRDVRGKTPEQIRTTLAVLKDAAHRRAIAPAELRGFTLLLSNFGTLAGRYGIPLVVPPAVAILGAGRVREDAVVVAGAVVVHRRMPLSLSFDHRCVTGGEACRFLAAVIAELEKPD